MYKNITNFTQIGARKLYVPYKTFQNKFISNYHWSEKNISYTSIISLPISLTPSTNGMIAWQHHHHYTFIIQYKENCTIITLCWCCMVVTALFLSWQVVALFALFTPTITATYLIVATDATTRKVGGAGATCLETRDVFEALYLSSPNHTVLHTQGILIDRDDPIITTALDMSDAEW